MKAGGASIFVQLICTPHHLCEEKSWDLLSFMEFFFIYTPTPSSLFDGAAFIFLFLEFTAALKIKGEGDTFFI